MTTISENCGWNASIDFVKIVESELEIGCFVEGVSFWPMIRAYLCDEIRSHHADIKDSIQPHLRTMVQPTSKYICDLGNRRWFLKRYGNRLLTAAKVPSVYEDPVDFLLIDQMGANFLESGLVKNRVFSPLLEWLRPLKVLKMTHMTAESLLWNTYETSIQYGIIDFPFESKLDRQSFYQIFSKIDQLLARQGYTFKVDRDRLVGRITQALKISLSFREFLANFASKAVLLASSQDPHRAGIIHACKIADVKVIEYQHGVLAPELHNIDSHGLVPSLSPDYFLTWGDRTKRYLNCSGTTKALVIGHPEYNLNLTSSRKISHEDELSILLVQQYTHDLHKMRMLVKIIAKALLKIEKNATIRIRLHPRTHHYWEQFLALHRFNSKTLRIQIEGPQATNLVDSLKWSDLVLVEFSTVAFEANYYGKHVAIFGDGIEIFSDLIKQGVFHSVSDESDMENVLRFALRESSRLSNFFCIDQHVIESSKEKIIQLLGSGVKVPSEQSKLKSEVDSPQVSDEHY